MCHALLCLTSFRLSTLHSSQSLSSSTSSSWSLLSLSKWVASEGILLCAFANPLFQKRTSHRIRKAIQTLASTPTNTARTELHSMITFHHANTRGSRAGRLRIAHLCVRKKLSSTCDVSFLAASGTDHKHKFSLSCEVPRQSGGSTQISSLTGYEPKSVEIKVIETEVIEPEDLKPRRIELDRNLGTDPYQSEEGFMRNFWKSWCRNVLPPVTYAFRFWLSGEHCRLGSSRWKTANHLECQLHRGNLMHCYMSEEQVQIVLKLDVKVVSGTECTGQTCCNVFMKKRRTRKLVLTRQMWEDLLLKEMNIICSVKQNLNLWDRNIKLDPSIIASVSFSNKVTLKDWSYRTLITDILSRDENKFVYNKNYLWRQKGLRDTQIRSMHEMGEVKTAQELRVDEVSVQKLRESDETIHTLTSE